jgi:lipopolysaccharide heptosyltransferase II
VNILIIKLSSVGDCLLATPAIEFIRKEYPEAFITWLIEDKSADIARLNPHVDEVIVIDKKKYKFKDYLSLIAKLRSRRYDLSIDLQGVDRTAIFGFLSGASLRYVVEYGKLSFLSNKKIIRKGRTIEHAVDFYLFLARSVLSHNDLECNTGSALSSGRPELTLVTSEEDRKFAIDFLNNNFAKSANKVILIGINPTGTWKTKRWPVKYFIELSKKLAGSFNVGIVIFGGKGEEYLADEILESLGESGFYAVSAVGKTTLKQARELLAEMDYFITPDSGLMHIASTIDELKTIALFGPTDPNLTGPAGKNFTVLRDNLICIPCFKKECPLNKMEKYNLKDCVLCMKRIEPDKVFAVIKNDIETNTQNCR